MRSTRVIIILLLFFGLPHCGGQNAGNDAPDVSSQIKGIANDATIVGGTVSLYQFSSGQKGTLLGITTTDSSGAFTLSVNNVWGPVWIEIRGGSYIDDATGSVVFLASGDFLSAATNLNPGENIANLAVTPLTTVASSLALYKIGQGASVPVAILSANNLLSEIYGFDIIQTGPLSLTQGKMTLSAGSEYGLLLSGISQLALGISQANGTGTGPISSIALADLMARDASDGLLDGKTSGQQLQAGIFLLDSSLYRNRLCQASILFLDGSRNLSGLGWNSVITYLNPIAANANPVFPASGLPKPIDNTPPQVTLAVTTPTSNANLYQITSQAIDDLSGVSSLVLSVDPPTGVSVSPIAGSPGMTTSAVLYLDFTSLPNGTYQVVATTVDNAGNSSQKSVTLVNSYHPPLLQY